MDLDICVNRSAEIVFSDQASSYVRSANRCKQF